MTHCPCCSNQMLRHLRQHQLYWFCRQCWQTIPIYNLNRCSSSPYINIVKGLGVKKHHSLPMQFNRST
ncbi:hypothetical protein D0A34_04010 [Microcoleus vaginatus PCC 9802]|nr:hypothetical protein MicvaDRAFT_2676 [Microcoleus vaginatus FGP-2]UNU18140.1 hypothetical protein D0A34_04010 [Microcoleus vaginatus PCC 9802]